MSAVSISPEGLYAAAQSKSQAQYQIIDLLAIQYHELASAPDRAAREIAIQKLNTIHGMLEEQVSRTHAPFTKTKAFWEMCTLKIQEVQKQFDAEAAAAAAARWQAAGTIGRFCIIGGSAIYACMHPIATAKAAAFGMAIRDCPTYAVASVRSLRAGQYKNASIFALGSVASALYLYTSQLME
jgi:hypothetical protein